LPGWQAAGKTGTSQDYRDAWFVGYTSRLIAGVWLGNDDNSPTKKVSGGNLPVEIWSRFIKAAHQGAPVAALPLGASHEAAGVQSSFSPMRMRSGATGLKIPTYSVTGPRSPPSRRTDHAP